MIFLNMAYTNSQILSAVMNKWLQPMVSQLASGRLQSLPFIQAIDNKVRSMGWVSPNWSIVSEFSPMIEPITGSIVEPMLNGYLSRIPDSAIPAMAHNIIDKALENGELSIFEGKITFDRSDLEQLKRLLDYNLPLKKEEAYTVKTEADTEA